MSVYLGKKSPFFRYDFQIGGHRFHGTTGTANHRKAEQFERDERKKAELAVAQHGNAPAISLAIDNVADRYWQEIGQHHAGSATTERDLARLVEYFGKHKLLNDIRDDDVTKLVSWRRGHRVKDHRKKPRDKDAPPLPFVSPATVNRSTTEVLKKLFTRAKAWGIRFDREPTWRNHWLKEPQERVRELHGGEGERLDAATRADYRPIMNFASASGLRLNECILRWSEVNFDAGLITKLGKGGHRVTVPITSTIANILKPLQGQHDEFVFTYVAPRSSKRHETVKDERYPITYAGLKTEWKRSRKRSGVVDFRFHDKRHDLATKLLRETGNLKLVQRALNHQKIETTLRYAHVLQDEVSEALERVQSNRSKTPHLDANS